MLQPCHQVSSHSASLLSLRGGACCIARVKEGRGDRWLQNRKSSCSCFVCQSKSFLLHGHSKYCFLRRFLFKSKIQLQQFWAKAWLSSPCLYELHDRIKRSRSAQKCWNVQVFCVICWFYKPDSYELRNGACRIKTCYFVNNLRREISKLTRGVGGIV